MTKEIKAVYEQGVIRPFDPLGLPEGSRLEVSVTHDRTQQEINYLLSATDEKIIEILKQLKTVVARLASGGQIDLRTLDDAIEKISGATKNIADPFPPGCRVEPVRHSEQTQAANVAETLAEIAALPVEGPSDTFSGRDHDSILYPKE